MIKKKYLFMFVFILVLGCYGVCYATVNMVPSTYNKSDTDVFEYLVTETYGDVDLNEPSNWISLTDYDNYQTALNVLYASSYTAFTDRGFSNRLYIVCSLTDITFSYSGSHTQVSCYGEIKSYTFYISSNINGKLGFYGSSPIQFLNSRSSTSGTGDNGYVLAYTTNGWYEMQEGTINLDDIITQPNFDPNGDELSYQQWGNRINNITTSYLSDTTNLGVWVEGFENGSDYLYNLVEIRPASTGYDYQVTGLVATNQDYIHISNDYHYVSVPTRILNFGKFYILSINYYVGSTLNNKNYFYYINGGSSSGDSLILFSGDPYMNTNQSTNAIINNQRSGDAGLIAALTDSTPPGSGDEPTIDDMPSIEMEDVSEEFFSWLLIKVKEVLDYNGVSNLTIPIYNQDFIISSDVFRLPNGVLRTFIQAGWYFIIGVPFLKYIRSTIEKLKGGNVPGADSKDDLLGNVL